MKVEAVVASAGIGKRLKARTRKPFLSLLGKPILAHTLQVLSDSSDITKIIVVVNRRDKKRCEGLIKRYCIRKVKAVIEGGKERASSVRNGLEALDEDTDLVLIHDGVRPFIDAQLIKKSVGCARRFGACIVGVPVKPTIKCVHRPSSIVHRHYVVDKTIDRSTLWEAQTPQVFRKELIIRAYKKFRDIAATDDSMLVERLGVEVRMVLGAYTNIKITTPEDLAVARAILNGRTTSCGCRQVR